MTALHTFMDSDGDSSRAGLYADNLYGTTMEGGAPGNSVTFKLEAGFAASAIFAGTRGQPDCQAKTVSALKQQYGSVLAAALALGFSSEMALYAAIRHFCYPV
jgi:hypothetical protein